MTRAQTRSTCSSNKRTRIEHTSFWYQHLPRKCEYRVYWERTSKRHCLQFSNFFDMMQFFKGVIWAAIFGTPIYEKVKYGEGK